MAELTNETDQLVLAFLDSRKAASADSGRRLWMCPAKLLLTLGRASALGTSERNVRFGHLVVESLRYHES
jgi:hypothetical protein